MARTINIFGTRFCVPKGKTVKEPGYIVCDIPVRMLKDKESREEVRKDINDLLDNFKWQEFSEEHFKGWLETRKR